MKNAALASRILLGAVFSLAGLSGFIIFHHPPALPPGLAGPLQDVFFRSAFARN